MDCGLFSVECPFYKSSEPKLIRCEAGNIEFETKREMKQFVKEYCDKMKTYVNCPTYRRLMVEYEK